MLWHSDLAAAVAGVLADTEWVSVPCESFLITARPKTVDTLVQKLRRTSLTLDQVQDVAGVRVDADMTLSQQAALAHEIADYFGADRAVIKDIRANPHSGYRAVHVWPRVPAGRVEIQIRTLLQSAWANCYERLGDVLGRGIRYGAVQGYEGAEPIVTELIEISGALAGLEAQRDVAMADPESSPARTEMVWSEASNFLLDELEGVARTLEERGRESGFDG